MPDLLVRTRRGAEADHQPADDHEGYGAEDQARGRIVGSEHYLTKPFTKDELLGAIEAHVGR